MLFVKMIKIVEGQTTKILERQFNIYALTV